MVLLCAVVGDRASVACSADTAGAEFIPRLQKRESQPERSLFWRGDWSMNIIWLKGKVVWREAYALSLDVSVMGLAFWLLR